MEDFESLIFANCYKMTEEDINSFADCLVKGFKGYPLYEYISGYKYNEHRMRSFWVATLRIVSKYGMCYASDRDINSVMIYLPPRTSEPGLSDYFKNRCLREMLDTGLLAIRRLVKFDNIANRISKNHITYDCGYLMAIATKPKFQKSGHGKKLLTALISYLNITQQKCYLETLKAGNVALYEHLGFTLKETSHLLSRELPIFAMRYGDHFVKD